MVRVFGCGGVEGLGSPDPGEEFDEAAGRQHMAADQFDQRRQCRGTGADAVMATLETMPGNSTHWTTRSMSTKVWAELLFFSFTTLIETDYGDTVPVTVDAGSAVMLEQLSPGPSMSQF